MELRQLKYFVRAAEILNFTHAADDLYITQSTLSHQIKELETSLDVLLFDRIGKRVRLTEAGEAMLIHARKIIRQAEEGRQMLKDLNNLSSGKLVIGSTYGLTELLIQTITLFNDQYPGVDIQIVFGSTAELINKLRTYEIDCMLSFMSSGKDNSLITSQLFISHLSLIVHKSHPSSSLKRISLQKLSGMSLALPSPSYSIRNFLDETFAKREIPLKASIEINDIHSLLELANKGRWATILMNSSLFDFKELMAVPLEGKMMNREATVTILSEIYHKRALVAFQELIDEVSLDYKN